MSDLKGRVALVTGGGRDVGAAISQDAGGARGERRHQLSQFESGEAEAVVAEIEKAGGKAKAYQADIADARRRQEDGGEHQDRFRRAGHSGQQRRPGLPQALQREHAGRLEKADRYLPLRRAELLPQRRPLLEASGRGRIISIMGDSSRVGESGLALAAAARAGTIALMKSLAREMGPFGRRPPTRSRSA